MSDSMISGVQKVFFSILWVLLKLFARLDIYGKENIDNLSEPLIVAANHRGLLDPPLIGLIFRKDARVFPLRYVAKPVFFRNSVGDCMLRFLGAFPATEFRKAIRFIRDDGGSLVIFPEGKIVAGNQMLDSKLGVGMLTVMFPDVYIIPVSISGTENAITKMLKLKRPHLSMKIGKPFIMREALKECDNSLPIHLPNSSVSRKTSSRIQQERAANIIISKINKYLD